MGMSEKVLDKCINKHLCQQLSTIAVHRGSTSFGISKRWFMNPTAPITCKYPKQMLFIYRKCIYITVYQMTGYQKDSFRMHIMTIIPQPQYFNLKGMSR